MVTPMQPKQHDIKTYRVTEEPYYLEQNGELEELLQCYKNKTPVALLGPTGCGKTTLINAFAYRLQQQSDDEYTGAITSVLGQEDLTATALVGERIIEANGSRWIDGPALLRLRHGGILYLDELPEARPEVLTVIHSITDERRYLSVPELEQVFEAPDNFMTIASWNPGYQARKMKKSTRNRFWAIPITYPSAEQEATIIRQKTNVDENAAIAIARVANHIRGLHSSSGAQGTDLSTLQLLYAAQRINDGVDPARALGRLAYTVSDVVAQEQQKSLTDAIDTILKDMGIS